MTLESPSPVNVCSNRRLVTAAGRHRTTHRLALLAGMIGLLALLPCALVAQSEVYLRVETNTFARIPVELKECRPLQQASPKDATRVLDILDNDLWMSSVIASFRSDEAPAGDSPWLEIASRGPAQPFRLEVHPRLSQQNDRVKLEADLIDSHSRRTLAQKSYQGCRDNLRLLVHSLADDIVNLLTGENGIAKSRIAFTAKVGESKEIFVMDFDGTNVRQLTGFGNLNLMPAWSADARLLALTSYRQDNPDLVLVDGVTGRTVRAFSQTGLQTAPVWSPDGSLIAFASTHEGNSEIYVMNAEGKRLRRLTHHPGVDSSPTWSPTGRELAFTSDRLGTPQIFIMDAEGSNVRRLTDVGDYNDSPAWSPKGDKIAFVSRIDGRFNIMTIEVTGENLTQLTVEVGSNEDPAWSPDGYRIVFSSTRSGGSDIYSMEWNGQNVRRLTHKGTCTSPAWSNNTRPDLDIACRD